jgi:hypothetical protein
VTPLIENFDVHGETAPKELHLDDTEIDRIVIAQADDANAWEALILETTPLKQVVSVMELRN